MSMGELLTWLKTNRRAVQNHLNTKKPACEPKKDWWTIALVFQCVVGLCNKYMMELQEK